MVSKWLYNFTVLGTLVPIRLKKVMSKWLYNFTVLGTLVPIRLKKGDEQVAL